MRPGWDEYFLQIAAVVATRSTCNRKQVGCVFVRDNHVFDLRRAPAAHPDMRALMVPLRDEFRRRVPIIFDER